MGFSGFFQKIGSYKKYYGTIYGNKDEYYKKFIELTNVDDILNISALDEDKIIHSENEIRIFGLSFNDSPGKLLRQMGRPRYRITDHILGLEHHVFFYKKDFFKHRAVIQFHFLDGVFVYCNISFLGLPEKYEKRLSVILNEKYNNGKGDIQFKVIMDRRKNFVWIEKSVYPSIIYRNNSSDIKKIALEKIEEQKMHSLADRQAHYEEWQSNL